MYGYLEYAPFGDLYDLADHARRNNLYVTNPLHSIHLLSTTFPLYNQPSNKHSYLPEFFLWRVFHGLAVALYNLDMGTNPPVLDEDMLRRSNDNMRRRYKEENWRSIMNLDIKSPNVVLAEPDEDYPAFPVPKMMDFGICFRHAENTVDRYMIDDVEALNGTEGWKPPVSFPSHHSYVHTHSTSQY